jgi:maleylacetoacetate isomerase/maleylpyruvate isomerase
MSLRLYTYWRSSAAFRVRIALNCKGLAYDAVPTHLLRGGGEQHQAAYRALNPQGLVPTLDDAGTVLVQSLAIIEYLEETHPHPPLLPGSARDRAAIRAMSYAIACDIHPLNNLRVLQYLRRELGQDDEAIARWNKEWMRRGFEALETLIARESGDGLHCRGTSVTMADICLLPQVFNARRYQLDLAPYPTLAGVAKHLETLPAFAAARPEAQPDAE